MDNEENVVEKEPAPEQQSAAQGEQASSEAPVTNDQEQTAPDNEAPVEDVKDAEQEQPQSQKPEKPEKPKKAAVKRSAQQKAKLFRMIYYPVLALFVALMLIFSAIDGVTGYSPSAYGDQYYTAVNAHIKQLSVGTRSAMAADGDGGVGYARDYIVSVLKSGGFTEVAEHKEDRDEVSKDKLERQKTDTDWAKDGDVKKPTVTVQTSTLDAGLQDSLGLSEHLVGRQIGNVIAALPSNGGSGAVVITVRYDSRPDTVGAADNAAFVANALQSLIETKNSGKTYKNDIVVVFTEAVDYSYGSYAFFNLFDGLDGVVGRATAGVDLDAYGNGGTLALTDASNAGLDYIYAYTKVADNALNMSVIPDTLPDEFKNRDAVKAFGTIPAVQVSVLGGLDAIQSSLDTAENISQAVVKQQARFIKDYIEKFGDCTDTFGTSSSGAAFFSYIDGGTIAYTPAASYVIGALILALAIGVVVTVILKKTFSLKNMLIAMGVQLLVVISTLAALMATYFLVTLMLTGFGVLPIKSIVSIYYCNAGIIIAAIIVTLAAAFGFTTVYKKLFRITSSDAVRGSALLLGLVGIVMSFACPAYSYITSWLGLTLLTVLLLSVCLHKKFKAKFGFGMDRLYLYAIPVALCLPLVMPTLTAVARLVPLVLLPVLFTVFTAMLGVGVPYLDRTQPVLDKLAKKLPKRTIRVERTVTERVEDRAKKGKFTERTVKRVEKEKIAVNYKNYFGISVAVVLGVIIALCSGGVGVDFDKTITNRFTYDNSIYNDSLVYEIDGTEQKIVVGDLTAYKFIRYRVGDLQWEGEKNRYSKSVGYNINQIIAREPSVEKDGNMYTVTTFDGARSNVKLTIPSARSITRITVKEYSRTDGDYEGYVYEYENRDQIVLRLPYGFDTIFTLEIEGASPGSIQYEEYRTVTDGDAILDGIDEWNMVKGSDEMPGLRAGIVIKRTLSV